MHDIYCSELALAHPPGVLVAVFCDDEALKGVVQGVKEGSCLGCLWRRHYDKQTPKRAVGTTFDTLNG